MTSTWVCPRDTSDEPCTKGNTATDPSRGRDSRGARPSNRLPDPRSPRARALPEIAARQRCTISLLANSDPPWKKQKNFRKIAARQRCTISLLANSDPPWKKKKQQDVCTSCAYTYEVLISHTCKTCKMRCMYEHTYVCMYVSLYVRMYIRTYVGYI